MSISDRAPMTAVLPDIPDVEDKLDFAPYANTMRDIILGERTQTPLTIGIFGSWGSGKTTLMRMIEAGLKDESERRSEANKRIATSEKRQKLAAQIAELDEKVEAAAPEEKEALQEELLNLRTMEADFWRRVTHPVWFNAWLYSKEATLWRALIAQVVAGVRSMPIPEWAGDEDFREARQREKAGQLDALAAQLYRVAGPTELGTLSISTANLLSQDAAQRDSAQLTLTILEGLDLLDNVATETDGQDAELTRAARLRQYVQQATAQMEQRRVESLEAFRQQFRDIIKEYVIEYGYLVVFVDDLDRCLPEKAVEVLEAIKLFLDVEGCIFVLGIDRDVVERGIRLRYGELAGARASGMAPFLLGPDSGTDKEDAARYRAFMQELWRPDEDTIDGGRYLEKIIQIPFVLPPISRDAMGQFIGKLAPDLPHIECGNVLASGLEPNPRQVKRALNIFALLWTLAQNKPDLQQQITPVRLAKLVVLQQRHAELYEKLREDPKQLVAWEVFFRQDADAAGFARWERQRNRQTTPRQAMPEELTVYPERRALRALLLLHPLAGQLSEETNFVDVESHEVAAYVYLTRSIKESVPAPEVETEPQPAESTRGMPAADDFDVAAETADVPPALHGAVPATGPGLTPKGLDIPLYVNVGAGLDEGRLGYLKERAYQAMAFGETRRRRDAPTLADLAEAGAEIYLQVASAHGTGPAGPLPSEPTEVRVPTTAVSLALPWEIVYDQPLEGVSLLTRQSTGSGTGGDVNPDGFWGFRHVVRRPLATGTGTGGTGTGETVVPYQGRPHVLLAQGRDREAPLVLALEKWADADRLRLTVARDLDDIRRTMVEEQPDIVVFHAAGRDSQGEIGLEFGYELLTKRELAAWGGRGGTGTGPGTAPGRQPGTALHLFDVGVCAGQKSEWPIWLGALRWLGAGGVVAPLEVTTAAYSGRFFVALLDKVLANEPLGEAMIAARKELLANFDVPFGLYYAHFGPPELKLAPAQP